MAVISRRSLFPGNQGHNVDRELWIPRILSTPRQQTMCPRTLCILPDSLPLVSVCLCELSLSTFFVSHLFSAPFPDLTISAQVTISRKGCLFCKSAKLVKVTSYAEPVAPRPELSRGDIEDRW